MSLTQYLLDPSLSWADVPVSHKEQRAIDAFHCQGEMAELIARVQQEVRRLAEKKERLGVRFSLLSSSEESSPSLSQASSRSTSPPHAPPSSVETVKKLPPGLPIEPFVPIKTLIVHNLPRDTTLKEIRDLFSPYGLITDVYCPVDKNRSSPYYGNMKGYGIIKFALVEGSNRAFRSTRGMYLRTHKLFVEFAKEDR